LNIRTTLAVFVVLVIVLASTTVYESSIRTTLTSTRVVTELETVSGPQSTATSTSTVVSTSTVTNFETLTVTELSSTSSPQPNATALELNVSIEPLASPQWLNITVLASVLNPTSSNITLSSREITNPAWGPCAGNYITTVNVYLGHFVQGNLSDSEPLALFNPYGAYSCPSLTQSVFNYLLGPGQAIDEPSHLDGYWSGTGRNYSFQPFQVGDYTIAVSDVWGQTALEYFAVAG